jgi:hypothetical protein
MLRRGIVPQKSLTESLSQRSPRVHNASIPVARHLLGGSSCSAWLASRQALPDRGQLFRAQAPAVTRWAAVSDVEPVFPLTYSSWLNWIPEPEFAALRYFALNGADHRAHAEQGDAIAMYIRWRNARAQLKQDFAPGPVIWTWTSYQNKVARRGTRSDGPGGEGQSTRSVSGRLVAPLSQ